MRIARRAAIATIVLAFAGMVAAGAWLWHSGYRVYIVHTGSMVPTYRPGSLVIDRPAADGYAPGDVITFRHSALSTDVVTHRITEITKTGLVHTKGDANRTADVWNIRPDQVRGRVITAIPFAGYALYYLQQPAGVASVVTGLIALILLYGLFFSGEEAIGMVIADDPQADQVPAATAKPAHAVVIELSKRPQPCTLYRHHLQRATVARCILMRPIGERMGGRASEYRKNRIQAASEHLPL